MSAISILKKILLESFYETYKRFQYYKMIYLGLFLINLLIRLPSSHFGYDSSNIFYLFSVTLILQILLSILMANLIITKIALDKNNSKADLLKSSLKFIRGKIFFYGSAILGFLLLVIPSFFALFFFCLTPVLEILEEHRGMNSLKRSYYLVRKDIPVVFIFGLTIFIFYIVMEIIFSHLRLTGIGVVIYFLSVWAITFSSVMINFTYVRLIHYLKELRVAGMINEEDIL